LPLQPAGVVLFAHGSGSSRHSPRNLAVAAQLREAGLGTLLVDLLSAQEDQRDEARFDIVQGVEMGRPSLLACSARRAPDGIRATVGGTCVPVLRGELEL